MCILNKLFYFAELGMDQTFSATSDSAIQGKVLLVVCYWTFAPSHLHLSHHFISKKAGMWNFVFRWLFFWDFIDCFIDILASRLLCFYFNASYFSLMDFVNLIKTLKLMSLKWWWTWTPSFFSILYPLAY